MKMKWFIGLFLLLLAPQAFAVTAVLVGVAAGVGAGALGATLATAIAIGMAAGSFMLSMSMKTPGAPKASQQELKQMLRSARAPKQVTYGRTLRSGNMLFAEEQVGDKENDEGTYNEWLYIALGLCNHSIHQIHNVYFNETPITDFGSKATWKLMNDPTETDQYLLDNSPSWQADMIGKGTAWLRFSMLFDRELYANGVPTPRIEFDGKNDIWDPRSDAVGYTNNAALVIADYFITYRGYSRDRIITEGFGSFIDAANLCDENITNPDGSTSKRYTINGTFELDEKPGQVLDDMLSSCGGQIVRIGNRIGLLPAAYYGPASLTLTDSDISDNADVQIQPEPSYGDSINTVKGSFVDPSQDYVETDYPAIIDENALVRDRGELATEINFRFVADPYQAQRLASIELKRQLSGGSISLTTNLRGLYARLGRVVNLNINAIDVIGEYRVTAQNAHLSNGVELSLIRDTIEIYDDAIGVPFVPPPLTNLPLGVAPPTSVQFILESIGDVVQGIVRWQINEPQSSGTEIRIKNILGDVVQVGVSSRNTYNVNGLIAGNYTVEVRTVTMRSGVSTWSSALIIVDHPPEIDSVTVNRSNWNLELIPNVVAGIPVGTLFEFWYLADSASYITSAPTYNESDRLLASKVFTGSSFNQGGLIPDRWNHYWIRSVNSYGQSDWFYVQAGTTREADLITTVVERLEAIEVQSANWTPNANGWSDYGYKLFSPASGPVRLPDGTVLNNPDGLAVFQNVYTNGHMVAKSLTFVSDDAIPDNINNANSDPKGSASAAEQGAKDWTENRIYPDQNSIQIKSAEYVQGVRGWAISQNGNAEFNNGVFRGTLYAEDVIGDFYKGVPIEMSSNEGFSKGLNESPAIDYKVFRTFNVSAIGFDRYFEIPPIWYSSSSGGLSYRLNSGSEIALKKGVTHDVGYSTSPKLILLSGGRSHKIEVLFRISRPNVSMSAHVTIYDQDLVFSYFKK